MAHVHLLTDLLCSEAQLVAQAQLRLVTAEEQPWWDQLMVQHHYLHNAQLVGEVLRYVAVTPEGRWLALLGWASPALHLRGRDRWIGWSESQRAARLPLVAQQSRFLLLTARSRFPNLASHLLALGTRRLPQDWLAAFGHTVLVAETFVDPEQFEGTCYKAAGWQALGPTGGFQRDYRDFYLDLDQPKQLWVQPLHPKAREWLAAPALPPHLGAQLPERVVRCPHKAEQLDSLWQCFHDRLTDPRARRGQRHRLACILTIAALATVVGEKGPKGFAAFAALLTQPQRRHLRCYPNPHTGQCDVPSEPTFRRTFKRVDRAAFARVLADWLAEQDPEKLTAIAVDGKTVKGSRQKDGRPVHLLSAVTHTTQRLLHQLPLAEKSNEITAFRPRLEPLPLSGVVVTADAEHCQRAHAQFLVYEKDADYLFLAKGNQPALEGLARTYREDNSPVRDPNATPCYAALRALAIFLCGQRKRTQRRPEGYHLPDFHRWARARLPTVLRWLTQTYTPP